MVSTFLSDYKLVYRSPYRLETVEWNRIDQNRTVTNELNRTYFLDYPTLGLNITKKYCSARGQRGLKIFPRSCR